MLTLHQEVLGRSFEHLRSCGGGREECVVLWVGPIERDRYVDEVVVPRHTASAAHYDIDPAWIGQFWLDLAEREKTVRCQVHTHPGSAYHSSRDDELALVHTPGYLSLVLPRFATGAVGLGDSFLAVRGNDGTWSALDPAETIGVEP
jgi:proteasome lid subunit RPN8/RPN11